MRPRTWTALLWLLLVTTLAAQPARATGPESRRGTVLVAGRPEAPPVLYVDSGTVTRVRFVDLVEPRALPGPEWQGHVEVAPFGERSLVLSPVKNLLEGQRLLLPVTGRTEAGEPVSLTLALVTRKEVVDAEAWVARAHVLAEPVADGNEVDAVARELLASHVPGGGSPRLSLRVPDMKTATVPASGFRAWVESSLQLEGYLFVTVTLQADRRHSRPWRLVRVRLEAGCPRGEGLPVRITSGSSGRYQFHTFTTPMPEGAGCVGLTLEEDGPRTLRVKELKVNP
ncbi:MAG TPA: DUF2381 family protein [Archangium sp.]|uniref:DUF2381 family protein n=1 Tax=Archangium sp. TaxID=1872627 RepID=UPI002E306999|nr:DUF2381 family protein [Archangium sp.]HEX5752590.1 DUF2381 family protein [Archangium sp.]